LQGSEESAKLVSMEQSSLLEQAVTLGDIIDPDSLQRVCMTFARTHKAGIAVLDAKGEVLVDVPAEHALCRRIAKQPGASLGCSFDHIVQTSRMLQRQSGPEDDLEAEAERPDGGPEQARCMCGLRYEMLPILHQDEVLGRLVFGPYRDPKLIDLPPELLTQLGDDDQVVEAVRADLLRIEARQPTQIRAAAAAINEVLSVIVQTGYARHLTSQIHIAAIQDAYNELSEKNRRLADSVEKLKELDKLKSSFLATVSHELRTPLTSVIGYSEMLLEGLAGELEPAAARLRQDDHRQGGSPAADHQRDPRHLEASRAARSSSRSETGQRWRPAEAGLRRDDAPGAAQDIALTTARRRSTAGPRRSPQGAAGAAQPGLQRDQVHPRRGARSRRARAGPSSIATGVKTCLRCVDLEVKRYRYRDRRGALSRSSSPSIRSTAPRLVSTAAPASASRSSSTSSRPMAGSVWVEKPDSQQSGSLFIAKLPLTLPAHLRRGQSSRIG
jgi:hypothetical protein